MGIKAPYPPAPLRVPMIFPEGFGREWLPTTFLTESAHGKIQSILIPATPKPQTLTYPDLEISLIQEYTLNHITIDSMCVP